MTTPISYLPASANPSGLDDTAIITALVAAQQVPITSLQSQQSNLQTEVSTLGSLSSDLNALQSSAQNLANTGVVAALVTSTNTSFTATAGAQAAAGEYSVQVTALAKAGEAVSSSFGGGTAPVTGASLAFTIQGSSYTVTIPDGSTLADVASIINSQVPPVTATIITTVNGTYLELASTQTGFPVGTNSANGFNVAETDTGSQGTALGLNNGVNFFQAAQNATLDVNGVDGIESTNNSVSNVIPGVTIALNSAGGPAENLVIGTSASGTTQNLQTFVSAYNQLASDLAGQLDVAPAPGSNTPPPALAGDSTVLGLQQQMQQMLLTTVPDLSFNSLASIGIEVSQGGQLSINQGLLSNAIQTDPQSVNALFAQSASGISAAVSSLATTFADPGTGAITQEQQNLTTQISALGQQATDMQNRLATYQQSLSEQFAAMEKVVSGFKSIQGFLNDQSGLIAAAGKS